MPFIQRTIVIILFMKGDSSWFISSPYPKAPIYNSLPQPIRSQPEFEQEDSQWSKHIYISPDSIPPIFRVNALLNQQSPWTKNISGEPEPKIYSIAVQGLMPESHQINEGINQPLVYSDNDDQEPLTPMKNQVNQKSKIQEGQIHTTGRSQLQHIVKKARPRQKGLRKLSLRAFEIVQQMKNATYKEVAGKLVQQLNDEQFEGENKQEQNIKRRVYDALNVLIALGVLKKDGRRIVSQKGSRKGRRNQSFEPQEIQALKSRIATRSFVLQERKKKLIEVQQKLQAIKVYLKRNRQEKFQEQKIIRFPFIGVFVNNSDVKHIKLDPQGELSIKSKGVIQPFGDIDCLKWLNIGNQRFTFLDVQRFKDFSIKQQCQEEELS